VSLEEKVRRRYVSGYGQDAIFETESEGWWATFEGWPASMRVTAPFFNPEHGKKADSQKIISRKPVGLQIGDVVVLTLRKDNA